MLEVLSAALLLLALLLLVVLGVLAGVGVWRLNRGNRVDPEVETVAPLTWLWSPTRPARMHRRLRTAVVAVHEPSKRPRRRSTVPPPGRTTELCRELADTAVHLDHHLVLVSRQPRPQRRRMLAPLEHQIADVERLSYRLARMKASLAPAPGAGRAGLEPSKALADIAQTLDLLDEAREELEHIERAEGLVDPASVMYASPAATAPMRAPAGAPAGAPRGQGPSGPATQPNGQAPPRPAPAALSPGIDDLPVTSHRQHAAVPRPHR